MEWGVIDSERWKKMRDCLSLPEHYLMSFQKIKKYAYALKRSEEEKKKSFISSISCTQ